MASIVAVSTLGPVKTMPWFWRWQAFAPCIRAETALPCSTLRISALSSSYMTGSWATAVASSGSRRGRMVAPARPIIVAHFWCVWMMEPTSGCVR